MAIAASWRELHSPRVLRERERLLRAVQAAASERTSAIETARAHIGAAFDEAAAINAFKIRVERFARLGPHHPAVRARFGARADLLSGRSLDTAIATVERWWRDECRAFAIARAFGRGTRLSLDVLCELRLILRWMRRKRMAAEFAAVLEALCEPVMPAAAE